MGSGMDEKSEITAHNYKKCGSAEGLGRIFNRLGRQLLMKCAVKFGINVMQRSQVGSIPTPPAKDSIKSPPPARPAAFLYWADFHVFFPKAGGRGGNVDRTSGQLAAPHADFAGLSPKTAAEPTGQKVEEFLGWLEETGRPADPCMVSRQDIEAWIENLFYRGNSNATRAAKLTALQHLFRWLVYEKLIPADLTEEIPKPKLNPLLCAKIYQRRSLPFSSANATLTLQKGLRDAAILILMAFRRPARR